MLYSTLPVQRMCLVLFSAAWCFYLCQGIHQRQGLHGEPQVCDRMMACMKEAALDTQIYITCSSSDAVTLCPTQGKRASKGSFLPHPPGSYACTLEMIYYKPQKFGPGNKMEAKLQQSKDCSNLSLQELKVECSDRFNASA